MKSRMETTGRRGLGIRLETHLGAQYVPEGRHTDEPTTKPMEEGACDHICSSTIFITRRSSASAAHSQQDMHDIIDTSNPLRGKHKFRDWNQAFQEVYLFSVLSCKEKISGIIWSNRKRG